MIVLQKLRELEKALYYSSFSVGISAVGWTWFTSIFRGIKPDYALMLLIFSWVTLAYLFDRIKDVDSVSDSTNQNERTVWIHKHMSFLRLAMPVLFLTGLVLLCIKSVLIPYLAVAALLSFFYNVKLPVIERSLKDLPGFKAILVGGLWACVTTACPIALTGALWTVPALSLVLFNFFCKFVQVNAADLRDYEGDKIAGVLSFPVLLGPAGGRVAGIIAALAAIMLSVTMQSLPCLLLSLAELLLACCYTRELDKHTRRFSRFSGLYALASVLLLGRIS